MEDRLFANCATSVDQTSKHARTQKRQMESHCCQLEGRWRVQDQLRLTPPAVVPSQTNSLSAAFKFHFQRRRALNSHHSVTGSLAVVLIVSLISCIPPQKKKKASWASRSNWFSLWGQKWKICNCFCHRQQKRMDFKLNCSSALLRRCRKE